MKNKIKPIFLFLVSIGLVSACVNDTFDVAVQANCVSPELTKTKEVSAIYALATNSTATYPADDIIDAYVISSDEGGNFYKSMYFQAVDGTKGFNLSVDEGNAYTKNFQPGKRVFLKLKDLAFANPTTNAKGLIFGAPPTEQYSVDRLSALTYKNYLIPSCDVVSEDVIIHKITLAQASSETYLNTLIEIDDVQFKTDCTTFSKADFDTNLKITNGITTMDVRTSRYANFARFAVPSGRGKIRGVLTKYGATYQIILRTERDVRFTNPRIQTISLPKGGKSLQYLGAFTENFESYTTTTTGTSFPKYINDAAMGYKYWDIATFSANKYLQMSAYNNGCSKAYFIVPVDMTAASGISFKSKDGYNDGNPLKIYYSINYVPGGNVNQATLIDITSKFILSTGNTSGYASEFINSGIYSIPKDLIGNGYFIFEYDGTTGVTTTLQLDDIIVTNK